MEQQIERVRYERLTMVCKKALEQTIKKGLDITKIQQCFPNIGSTPNGLHQLTVARSQIVKYWHEHGLAEFELIFKERDIERKLNELDEIIQKAQYRKQNSIETPIKVHELSPEDVLQSTVLSDREPVETLRIIYDQLCADNQQMLEEMMKLVQENDEIKQDIDENLTALRNHVAILKDESEKLNLDELLKSLE